MLPKAEMVRKECGVQKDLLARFLSWTAYPGHVGLAAAKPWWFMPKWKDGNTVEFIIFRVHNFVSA